MVETGGDADCSSVEAKTWNIIATW